MTGRILIVDDSPVIGSVVQTYLAPLGRELVVSTTAEDALRTFESEGAEIVVSDVRLPGMNGVELTQRLKRIDPRVRIVLISGMKEEERRVYLQNTSADAFVPKPLDGEELFRVVERLSSRVAPDTTIGVVVVDDSTVERAVVRRMVEGDQRLQVVGEARDRDQALAAIGEHSPQLVVVDAHMPDVVGLVRAILDEVAVRIVLVSDPQARTSSEVFDAVREGALDLVRRPRWGQPGGPQSLAFRERLLELAEIPIVGRRRARRPAPRGPTRDRPVETKFPTITQAPSIIGIAASTGGPASLAALLGALAGSVEKVPVLVAVHVLDGFDRPLVRWLQHTTGIQTELAVDRDAIVPGRIVVVPYGCEVFVTSPTELGLRRTESGGRFRGAASALLTSMADVFGDGALGVILTGMGDDGVDGLARIKARGGTVVAQSPSTCVVDSMPRAAIARGIVDEVLDLPDIGRFINTAVHRKAEP